ncbi:hypothetical protein B0J11DRAFT_428227 [Dendryphion nanum]|uniref:Uncharacterized protein n=1 Tax=Dendryphion nanum TaxID=256645 RepID=A0A9P9E6M3_9PLEO|nr:hypothetical protein B0J11DRAFT_428227 [Dendryphion nanum]
MAVFKSDRSLYDAKPNNATDGANPNPLARVMQEFEDLVMGYETGLLRSLEDTHIQPPPPQSQEEARQHACHLAITELSTAYARKQIRRSLTAAESQGKSAEDQLHTAAEANAHMESHLDNIHNGHFRLYSTELFDLLGQPTDMRFGTLRFQSNPMPDLDTSTHGSESTTLEMALNSSFFVADSAETLPFHTFRMPEAPSLRNRGILCRKPEEHGALPAYDSWLLFTFLGNGCLKIEVPIELCADVYGGPLRGRENEEVVFWGVFVEDETTW